MRAILIYTAMMMATIAPAAAENALESLLASASPEAGASAFRKCQACHTIEKGGANRVGPNLYNVINRPVGSHEGFRYSRAMADFGGAWSVERLDAYLKEPRQVVKGTRMIFAGLKDDTERANLIAFLNTHSDNPLPFGQGGKAQAGADTPSAEADFGQLVVAPGVETTFYACTACHSEMIVAQQGKTRQGWDKLLDWMVEEQGMAELSEEDRNVILDYLAAHYNTDRPNFPR